MDDVAAVTLPADLAAELEKKFFWWEPVGSQPRTHERILAQAMNHATFEEAAVLEARLGATCLARALLKAEPGWIDDRSWAYWRGRLARSTGLSFPEKPRRRSFNDAAI